MKDSIVDTTHVNARFSDSVSRLAATDLTAGLRIVLRKGNVFNTNKSKLKETAICFLKRKGGEENDTRRFFMAAEAEEEEEEKRKHEQSNPLPLHQQLTAIVVSFLCAPVSMIELCECG